MSRLDFGLKKTHEILVGGVFASSKGDIVRTLLGSCIAVCLRDPIMQVGGMNHFMLPDTPDEGLCNARYGVHAMEVLINRCMRKGGERSRLEAKVFGGGHVLRMNHGPNNVPERNIRFVQAFLQGEGIPIVKSDLGGETAREIYFFTDTGYTLLRRIKSTSVGERFLSETAAKEERLCRRARAMPRDDRNVTLFGYP